ncbi:long-chain-fatty-acid--CoA ligase [Parerythrobacter jejuensis]|uniref:3-methylmercaptopropionyl-CoA ligase n=1 Tax=Parerythrobacter jejuensis TaxID=795812 RepID=A0A845AW75_9SPHN|nr:long-chain-fatty-acid--CoA ligase [Parerythrobacter jejuensis]MXP31029.1 long-chain-fatty-acid--CoA ligase [Parerythrobacter jejuensis]MXP33789.1 long-chain-fatty-acid--CoA ligase [Parerythrobacter jejuensis]
MATTLHPQTFGEALAAHAQERPDQIALRFGDRVTDYAAFDRHADQIANGLAAKGYSKGDRIAYLGKNSDHAVELALGCARGGYVFVPVIWRLAAPEVDFITKDAGATILFVEEGFESVPFDGQKIVMEREFEAWRDAQSDSGVATQVTAQDPFLQLYTSGTTGMPKGVVLSHYNGTAMRPILQENDIYWYNADPGDTMILAMPYGHIAGVGSAAGAALAGQELIVHAEFDPALTIKDIRDYRVKWIFLVPAAIRVLLSHPDANDADFSSIKGLTYGASPIPLDLLKEGVERLGCEFAQLYGMTETYGTVVSLPPDDHRPGRERVMRSAGKPLPGVEIQIVDESLTPVPTGEIGEVLIKSPTTMLEYWNRPEENAKTLTGDGWLRTGDAGIVDEEGYLYIQDRIKDMIISGGENVYPAEVESALFGHDEVADVAVIGVPDEKWGETVKAVVVAKPGCTPSEDSIIGHARERIAGFKCPKSVDFIEALPRNPSGKILRRELRAPYWEGKERAVN